MIVYSPYSDVLSIFQTSIPLYHQYELMSNEEAIKSLVQAFDDSLDFILTILIEQKFSQVGASLQLLFQKWINID